MIFNKLFTKYLIDEEILAPDIAEQYYAKADSLDSPMYIELINDKIIEEDNTYRALADFLGFEYRYCQVSEINLDFVRKYPRDLLLEYQCVPFELKEDVLVG